MKVIYRADDGTEFSQQSQCEQYEALKANNFARTEELRKKSADDFRFLVTCASKGNMAMYELLKDRDL